MNVDELRRYAKPRRMKWHHVELLTSADERAYYRDGDLMLCPDGTVVLGPESYPPGLPIPRREWKGIWIYRARRSNMVQVEARPGERCYFTYQRVLFWWRWRQSYLADRPPSLLCRLVAIRR